jgi:secondary thiamine-phosphate synthase enzyme
MLVEPAVTPCWHHLPLVVTTERPTQFIDLTDRLEAVVSGLNLQTGLLNLQTRHTTTGLIVNEHEPLLLSDFAVTLGRIAPTARRYRHDDVRIRTVNVTPDERVNGNAHCRALILPTAVTLNIAHGRVDLGRWQRVFFVELDGPLERTLSIVATGQSYL